MVIKVLCFSIMSISSTASGTQALECFYNNITTSNLPKWLLFAMMGIILSWARYFSTKSTYTFLEL